MRLGFALLVSAALWPRIGSTETNPGFVGVVFSREDVVIRAEVPERVTTVSVELGDPVERGTTLVILDDRLARLKLDETTAQVQSSEAEVGAAKSDSIVAWRRYASRFKTSALWSKEEVERASLEYDQAVASKAAADGKAVLARAAAARTRLELRATRVKATFTGWVAAKYVTGGQQVSLGDPLVRIIGIRDLWVRFAMPADLNAVIPPAPIQVEVPGFSPALSAVLRHISPDIDAASGMRIAEAELNPGRTRVAVKPGTAVRCLLGVSQPSHPKTRQGFH